MMAAEVLQKLPQHLAVGLNVYCIPRAYPEADYYSIKQHPQIVCKESLSALDELVHLASLAGEGQTAFMFSWKRVLLEGCVEMGIDKFFAEFREGGEKALQALLWKVGSPYEYMSQVPPELLRFYESSNLKPLPTNTKPKPKVSEQISSNVQTKEPDSTPNKKNAKEESSRTNNTPTPTTNTLRTLYYICDQSGDSESAIPRQWIEHFITNEIKEFGENDIQFQSLLRLLLKDVPRFRTLAQTWGSKSDEWRLATLTAAADDAYPVEDKLARRLINEACPELDDLRIYAEDFGSRFFELLFYAAQWPEDKRDDNVKEDIQKKVNEEIAREKIETEIICLQNKLMQNVSNKKLAVERIMKEFDKLQKKYRTSGISNLYYIWEEREWFIQQVEQDSKICNTKPIIDAFCTMRRHMLIRLVCKVVVAVLFGIDPDTDKDDDDEGCDDYESLQERMQYKLKERQKQIASLYKQRTTTYNNNNNQRLYSMDSDETFSDGGYGHSSEDSTSSSSSSRAANAQQFTTATTTTKKRASAKGTNQNSSNNKQGKKKKKNTANNHNKK